MGSGLHGVGYAQRRMADNSGRMSARLFLMSGNLLGGLRLCKPALYRGDFARLYGSAVKPVSGLP